MRAERLPYRKETSALGWDTKAIGERVMEVATLTAKGQVTVPKAVRETLGLRQGDQLSWEMEDDSVRVRAIAPLDLAYLRSLGFGEVYQLNGGKRATELSSVHYILPRAMPAIFGGT